MGHHEISYTAKCESCGATGLYVGMAERDGSAVVCRSCKGTGQVHRKIHYEDFEGRVRRQGVKRVLQANPGFCVGNAPDGSCHLEDFGGMDFNDWWGGVPFVPGMEMRNATCPCWWYQSADYSKKPAWEECAFGRPFNECRHFANKAACWDRWDRENGHGG